MTLPFSPHTNRALTRRQLLAGIGGVAAAGALGLPGSSALGAATGGRGRPERRRPAAGWAEPHHLAWVWQFHNDGDPAVIRDTLAASGLGVAVKTHDGTNWMSNFDRSPNAISGPARVEAVAAFFENSGVPFHAWTVVTGEDVEAEASMAADVLSAGARSLFIDLEPHDGFWTGSAEDAARFGEVLRQLQPSARVSTSVDARPWTLDDIPLDTFAMFSDEIAPQAYWRLFSSVQNLARYVAHGNVVGLDGVTPDFVVSTAAERLSAYGLPLHPIGDGTVAAHEGWSEFIDSSYAAFAEAVSVWRFGVAEPGIWELLKEVPPRPLSYVVQPGDSLASIAEKWGTSVQAIVEANGIADPNLIHPGVRLHMPYGTAPHVDPPAAGEAYIVESGDTLWSIAQQFGTSVDALMAANGLSDQSLVLVGQRLVIP